MSKEKKKKLNTNNKESEDSYRHLLKLAIAELNKNNYSAFICSLTSVIDHCKQENLAIEAKFWLALIYEKGLGFGSNEKNQAFNYYEEVFDSNSKFKEKARDHLIMCYSQGIGVKKDVSKAEELYSGKPKKIK
ncbi:1865_t:CDS:1 [Dentiscutata erythropus]|uniref:1865_t:CDS:1 n=1 Tax=Dentiscutata erythropus TaxID=1348616 RepID=A0A9N9DNA8_9GLOM|nr:1865_t:CDS:1 [Dentiscutata erythropus]